MRRTRIVLVMSVMVAAGCSGTQVSGVPIGSTLAPPTTTGPVVTTTDPPPAEPTFPPARDGKNLAACADGNCQVEVRAPVELDLAPATGFTHLTIHTIDQNGVHMTALATGGGTFEGTLYADPGAAAKGTLNGQLSITTLATQDGRALLTIATI